MSRRRYGKNWAVLVGLSPEVRRMLLDLEEEQGVSAQVLIRRAVALHLAHGWDVQPARRVRPGFGVHPGSDKVSISVRFPPAIHQDIKMQSQASEVNMTDIVARAVDYFLLM